MAAGVTSRLWEMGDIVDLLEAWEAKRALGGGRLTGPVVPHSFNDPKHWRQRAEEARVHAEQMKDPVAKRMMLQIVEDYEKLAKRAEERLKSSPQSN
jgi:hypothetical protein